MKKKADWCAAALILVLTVAAMFGLYGLAYYGTVTPCLAIQSESGGPALVREPQYRFWHQLSPTLFYPMHWVDRTLVRPEQWKSIPLYDLGQLTIPQPEFFE